MTTSQEAMLEVWNPVPRYDRWLETLKIPIFRGYHVEDLRTMELGPWGGAGVQRRHPRAQRRGRGH